MSTFNDMVDFIKSAWPAKKFIVPCLVGPAGIGKTAAVKQAAEELGAGKVITIIASQILPNEVSGITMPVPETKAMEIFDHYRLSSLEDGDVLFFDELLEADQLVLSACLTLIESRELMSGRKLPDCMVIAATNPTIKPNMLKENIRQRFVWRSFDLDREGTRNYIIQTCGFDPGLSIVNKLEETGNEYNILTPRSLTKMCQWLCKAEDAEQAKLVAKEISTSWNSSIGTELLKAYLKKNETPEAKAKRGIKQAIQIANSSIDMSDEQFESATLAEIMETLQSLSDWKDIEHALSMIEYEEELDEIQF